MGCINPDGTLTETARKVLLSIKDTALNEKGIAQATGLPMFKVRASIRDMFGVGFLYETDSKQFEISPVGVKVLES